MMTAIADGYHTMKQKDGYHVCLMCPPSLTKKWPQEIRQLIPEAEVHVISHTDQLIRFHSDWTQKGRPKPVKPTFFIISFTIMRGDARTMPAIDYRRKVMFPKEEGAERGGFYCHSCGKAHQVIENKQTETDENGIEREIFETRNMESSEFGTSRRIHTGVLPANAFCFYCGDSFWTKRVPVRYGSFKAWTAHEKKLAHAIRQESKNHVQHIQSSQPKPAAITGMPRRVAAIEYIRRKMKHFFDMAIVDEIHELKAGMSAQGNALGALVESSKKVIGGTGTLFGGKAEDVYYLLWRLFPQMMAESGYRYEEVTRFNEEYGNIEETTYESRSEASEYTNTNSRGGDRRTTKKVMPGISPFIFGKYLVQNVINVRLKDVWPDPVELVDTPTIFVPMSEELRKPYDQMLHSFERAIDSYDDGFKLFMKMTDYGIAYPDNPFKFPDATHKNADGKREVFWDAHHLNPDCTLPKEAKLQEIIQTEMAEGRKAIVYVRDTGTSVSERDLRPRLKEKLEEIGAKVCILDTSTTKTNNRSEWLANKIEQENYDVCIVSQELVKVGLDLLCTPTLIYYQFSWSLFTINQSARRAWRLGQDKECRLFYLAYKNSFQEKMAELIAKKNRATAAINGEVSSDGLSAMLGDEGDLQSMLIESVKNGGAAMKGSAEEWIHQTSDRARQLLANIGKKKQLAPIEAFRKWVQGEITGGVTRNAFFRRAEEFTALVESGGLPGFAFDGTGLTVDYTTVFGFDREYISDGSLLYHMSKPLDTADAKTIERDTAGSEKLTLITVTQQKTKLTKKKVAEDQLAFDLFA